MTLKLITANIRFENENDGVHSWANRLPLLKEIISNFGPDILATQEGLEIQIKSLSNQLNLVLVQSHRDWISNRMYPCLYINEATIKVQQSGDIWLSETPEVPGSKSFNSAFPRLCTWIQINHIPNNKEYIIINTHLDHILEETRLSQIKVLICEIGKIKTRNLPVILMGDFNDSPSGEVMNSILNSLELVDPWKSQGHTEETSHHGFKGDRSSGVRIDWILIPQTFTIENIYLEKKSYDDIYPSDHYPLLATVIPN